MIIDLSQKPRRAHGAQAVKKIPVVFRGGVYVAKKMCIRDRSKAHRKIANYHFTTLYPILGVVYVDECVSFVMADIPGIIEGASEGAGLEMCIRDSCRTCSCSRRTISRWTWPTRWRTFWSISDLSLIHISPAWS